MHMRKPTAGTIVQACIIGGLFLFLLFSALSQKITIGQKYQQVFYNGELVGNIEKNMNADRLMHEVRRELAAESENPVCMDYEYSVSTGSDWFTPLMEKQELKDALKEKMRVSELDTLVEAYTVAIEGYRANFQGMEEVTAFLNTVKDEADENGQFTTAILAEEGHISGIYKAGLTETNPVENTEVIPEETLADNVISGVNAAFNNRME